MKALVLGNLFSILDWGSLPLGGKNEEKKDNRFILVIIPYCKLPVPVQNVAIKGRGGNVVRHFRLSLLLRHSPSI